MQDELATIPKFIDAINKEMKTLTIADLRVVYLKTLQLNSERKPKEYHLLAMENYDDDYTPGG